MSTHLLAASGSDPGRMPTVVPPADLAPLHAASMTPPSPPHTTVAPASGQQSADLGRELFSAIRGVVSAANHADQQLPLRFAHSCMPSAAVCAFKSTSTPILPSSNRRSSCLLSKGSCSAVPCTSTYLKSPVITTFEIDVCGRVLRVREVQHLDAVHNSDADRRDLLVQR